jgi:hypothetical protein
MITLPRDHQEIVTKMRLLSLEWLAISVEEIGRAGLNEQKRWRILDRARLVCDLD